MIAQFRVGPVRPLDLNNLWTFGTLQQLELIRETFIRRAPLRDWKHILVGGYFALRLWLNATNKEEFPESYKLAGMLLQLIDTALVVNPSEILDSYTVDQIANFLGLFDSAFRHELGRVPSFVLEEKRGYGVTTLVSKAHNTISIRNQPYLSDFAEKNIKAAGRCFVFDCFTATGFHATRAVEDVARRYYTLVTGREPFEPTKSGDIHFYGLGRIGNELSDKVTSLKGTTKKHTYKETIGKLETVVSLLGQICLVYRDALAHPDIISLEEDEAADVFFQSINAISTMLDDVRVGGSHFAVSLPCNLCG